MNYVSTRDDKDQLYSFGDILLKGLADDGGLFFPVEYPSITIDQLISFKHLSYADLATKVMFPFVDGSLSYEELSNLTNKTYQASVFKSNDIVPVTHLFDHIYLQDLSSGPSLAFKDMAMQFLGHLMEFELARTGRRLTILGASSGDTVSAAEEAMRSKSLIDVVMLTPKQGMSVFQKAQAGSILDSNIFNVSVDGSFDICQDLVKSVNKDLEFKKAYSIGAVNSINWGRILAQLVYYVKGYLSVVKSIGEPIDVCVPSGNFGNVLAAYIVKQMGLPLRHLVVSTNENIVLDTFFKTGIYQQYDVVVTSSPSMDISKASNIERLFYDLVGRNGQRCNRLMRMFEKTKRLDLSEYLSKIQNELGFVSGSSTHIDRLNTIKYVYERCNIVVDPHTAAGLHVSIHQHEYSKTTPILCMETAKPAKFEDTIKQAIGFIPQRDAKYLDLEQREQRFYAVDDHVDAVKHFITEHIKL